MFLYARVVWPWLLCPAFLASVAANGCAPVSESGALSPEPGGAVSDAGNDATGATASDASACRPGDVETYQPPPYRPAAAAWQGVCSTAAITGFFDACLGPQATTALCAAFKSDKTTGPCAACILTADTASHSGPLISHGSFITTNVAGCVELTDPAGFSCAKTIQALDGCELAACQANCPINDSTSRIAYDACAAKADVAGCASYNVATGCLADERDGGRAVDCLMPAFSDFYNAVVPLFCGAPAPWLDGSSLPEFDASADGGVWTATDASIDARIDAFGDARGGAPSDAMTEATKD